MTRSAGHGRIAAVTGAARGLGTAIARRLCASARDKIFEVADQHEAVYMLVSGAGMCSHHATSLGAAHRLVDAEAVGALCLVEVFSPSQLNAASLRQSVIRALGTNSIPDRSASGSGHPLTPLTNGATFAGFKIVRPLGSGGMGEVYLAEHPRLPRNEALKILPVDVSGDDEYRRRFNREADLAAAVWHSNIVGMHDRGEHARRLWISMDYGDGADCARLLRERYPAGMPRSEVFEIVGAAAEALDYAHDRGLLHRDVKPANMMLTREGSSQRRTLLTDFGTARRIDDISGLTATNMTLGTVDYAAPEQLTMDSPIDGRADQYALAATAFHLLTGAPPFPHSSSAAVISDHLNTKPPTLGDVRPELADFDAALSRALAKHPDDRFDRCRDFAAALQGNGGTRCTRCNTAAAITRPAPAATRSMSGGAAAAKPPMLRPATVAPAILALMLIASMSIAPDRRIGRMRSDHVSADPRSGVLAPLRNSGVTKSESPVVGRITT
jgi:hypothetical protein